jgi:hypothetical protein
LFAKALLSNGCEYLFIKDLFPSSGYGLHTTVLNEPINFCIKKFTKNLEFFHLKSIYPKDTIVPTYQSFYYFGLSILHYIYVFSSAFVTLLLLFIYLTTLCHYLRTNTS